MRVLDPLFARVLYAQSAGHAQVDQHTAAPVEVDEDVLALPPHGRDGLPDASFQLSRVELSGEPQRLSAGPESLDAFADHLRPQRSNDGFYFG